MNRASVLSALVMATVALSACGGAHMGASSSLRDASMGHNVAPPNVTGGAHAASSADAGGPHGAEIESGSVVSITDGNVHMAYPASATVERTADGVAVTIGGKTRKFSRAATVTSGGSYHIYAPVNH
jgi:hypothetical protein